MLLALKKEIIYGPVQSRRIGSSLGINVLAGAKKVCSLNCVYCQYGWTRVECQELEDNNLYACPEDVLNALEQTLKTGDKKLNCITLSGNGEPGLHPDLEQIVDGMIQLRNRYATEVSTVILSNSTRIMNPDVRKAIAKLDMKIMKLDCGKEKMFRQYNRPLCPTSLDDIVEGLSLIKDVIIQSLFTAGEGGNFKPDHLGEWIKKITYIKPGHVQIYTLDRGYPSKKIYPLEKEELMKIKSLLIKANINAEVYF
jgi:wyosine [tRNA(Phe)-imidazoG37] synthetase (radical SAM superfamily)